MHGRLRAAQFSGDTEGIFQPVREADRQRAVRRLDSPRQEGHDAQVSRPHWTAEGIRAASEPQNSSGTNDDVTVLKALVSHSTILIGVSTA